MRRLGTVVKVPQIITLLKLFIGVNMHTENYPYQKCTIQIGFTNSTWDQHPDPETEHYSLLRILLVSTLPMVTTNLVSKSHATLNIGISRSTLGQVLCTVLPASFGMGVVDFSGQMSWLISHSHRTITGNLNPNFNITT